MFCQTVTYESDIINYLSFRPRSSERYSARMPILSGIGIAMGAQAFTLKLYMFMGVRPDQRWTTHILDVKYSFCSAASSYQGVPTEPLAASNICIPTLRVLPAYQLSALVFTPWTSPTQRPVLQISCSCASPHTDTHLTLKGNRERVWAFGHYLKSVSAFVSFPMSGPSNS